MRSNTIRQFPLTLTLSLKGEGTISSQSEDLN